MYPRDESARSAEDIIVIASADAGQTSFQRHQTQAVEDGISGEVLRCPRTVESDLPCNHDGDGVSLRHWAIAATMSAVKCFKLKP